ncbi:WhiB family transcriptional regulator [Lentzea nigeriaca]|uniref:WhiB family transcriptional regulator n=1 Tax=Lentzea nigeriaca TaxID=1128665 RepID=UPI00195A83FE
MVAVLHAPRWHPHAACRNTGNHAGWIDAEPGSDSSIRCKEVCLTCPVRLPCALTALAFGEREGV